MIDNQINRNKQLWITKPIDTHSFYVEHDVYSDQTTSCCSLLHAKDEMCLFC